MSKTSADFLSTTGVEKPKNYLCADGFLGCGNSFDKNSFRFDGFLRISTLCDRCEAWVAAEFGVEIKTASAVGTVLANMDWYYRQIPTAQDLDRRTKVRILLLAAGAAVHGELESETARAEKLKSRFPTLVAATVTLPEFPQYVQSARDRQEGDS